MAGREVRARQELSVAQAELEGLQGQLSILRANLRSTEQTRSRLALSVEALASQRDELLQLGLRVATVEEFRDGVVKVIDRNYAETLENYYRGMHELSSSFEYDSSSSSDSCFGVPYVDYEALREDRRKVLALAIETAEEQYPWLAPRWGHLKQELAARYAEPGGIPSGVLLP